MIDRKLAKDIIDNWLNGNHKDVKKQMTNKSKCFALDLIPCFVADYGYKYHNAIYEIYKMCEV